MNNLDRALATAERGYFVGPFSLDRRPLVKHHEFTRDPNRIRAMWKKFPNGQVGINHALSGTAVVDIDDGAGKCGSLTWDLLTDLHGPVEAPTVTTPHGGQHLFFRQPEAAVLRNSDGGVGPDVDIKVNGVGPAPGARRKIDRAKAPHLPRTVMTGAYEPIGFELLPPVRELPVLVPWIADHPSVQRPPKREHVATGHAASSEVVLARVESFARELATCPVGSGNSEAARFAFCLLYTSPSPRD